MGVGAAGLAGVAVTNGWISGNLSGLGGSEIRSAVSQPAGEASDSPAAPIGEKRPSKATHTTDPSQPAPKERAVDDAASASEPVAPRWAAYFAQPNGQKGSATIRDGSIQRHLNWSQIDLLNEVALTLPASAAAWLTIECGDDGDSRGLAKEIFDAISISRRINAVRVGANESVARGIFVSVSNQNDEHFSYAQLLARVLNTPERPVHFGPTKDARPGTVKIIVQSAEATPVEQAHR